MYTCTYTYTYTYRYICVYIYIYTYKCTYIYVHIIMHVCCCEAIVSVVFLSLCENVNSTSEYVSYVTLSFDYIIFPLNPRLQLSLSPKLPEAIFGVSVGIGLPSALIVMSSLPRTSKGFFMDAQRFCGLLGLRCSSNPEDTVPGCILILCAFLAHVLEVKGMASNLRSCFSQRAVQRNIPCVLCLLEPPWASRPEYPHTDRSLLFAGSQSTRYQG